MQVMAKTYARKKVKLWQVQYRTASHTRNNDVNCICLKVYCVQYRLYLSIAMHAIFDTVRSTLFDNAVVV